MILHDDILCYIYREREVTCGTSHHSQNSMNHYQIKLQISKHWPVNWVSIGATDLLYVLCLNIGGHKRPGTASCSQSYFNSTRISPYKQVMHAVQQGCKLQCDTNVTPECHNVSHTNPISDRDKGCTVPTCHARLTVHRGTKCRNPLAHQIHGDASKVAQVDTQQQDSSGYNARIEQSSQ